MRSTRREVREAVTAEQEREKGMERRVSCLPTLHSAKQHYSLHLMHPSSPALSPLPSLSSPTFPLPPRP